MRADPTPTFQERLEYAGFLLLHVFVGWMSLRGRSNFAGWCGRNIGARLGYAARVEANLTARRPRLGADERRGILVGMMDNFARTAVEYSRLPDLFAEAPDYEVEGLEHLEAARDAGGRLVIASAHYGNWEAVRAVGQLHGAPIGLVHRPFNNPLIDRAWGRYIRSVGAPCFAKGREGARGLFRHLASGGAALILIDQRMGGAPLIDFMGAPAETSLAAAQLALRTKAPLITAYAKRTETGFRVVFEPPIPPATPEAMMREANRRIETWVDAAPEQWFWAHRRWRVRQLSHQVRKMSAPSADGAASADG